MADKNREDRRKIPIHVVIIPDGNRRWAKEKGLIATAGHVKAGERENLKGLIMEAKRLGVKYLSLWGFSTENWERDKKEVSVIFDLLLKTIRELREDAMENKVRFRHLGRKDRLTREIVSEIEKLENETRNYDNFTVLLCFDYGGRDEIVRTVNKIINSGAKKVDEKIISENLDTAGIPDPDLIIRTGNEHRTSGFMPFQSVYAELYFVGKYFPDFNAEDLREAVLNYEKRQRRFGK